MTWDRCAERERLGQELMQSADTRGKVTFLVLDRYHDLDLCWLGRWRRQGQRRASSVGFYSVRGSSHAEQDW